MPRIQEANSFSQFFWKRKYKDIRSQQWMSGTAVKATGWWMEKLSGHFHHFPAVWPMSLDTWSVSVFSWWQHYVYNGNTNVYLIGSLKALTAIGRVNQWESSSNKHSYRFVGDLLHLRHCAHPPQELKTHDYVPFSLYHFSPSSSSLFFFSSPKPEVLWWVCSFALSFNKHLLSSDYVPGVVLGSEDTSLTKTMFMFSWRL